MRLGWGVGVGVGVGLGLCACGTGMAQTVAAGGEHQVSGNLRLDYYRNPKQYDDRRDAFGPSAEIKLDSHWSEQLTSKADLRWHQSALGEGDAQAEVLEAYALWHGRQIDIALGKQIVAWGRADGINPTDNISPRNYRIALPYEEDQRAGSAALRVNYFPDTQRALTLTVAPGFQPSRLSLPQTDGLHFVDQQPPRSRWPFAVKFDQRGEAVDWSISYFRGYKLLPELRATPFADQVALHYPKIAVFGADIARNVGAYGLRAELARVLRDESQAADGLRNNWMLVTGIDRNFENDLNINLQLVAQQNTSDAASIAALTHTPLGAVNAVTFSQEGRHKLGATLRLGKKWRNGTLEAELLLFQYVNPATAYWRPLLAYALRDNVKLTLGAEHYAGRADSFFGRNKAIQTVFAEVKVQF
jgi:hypothetical protein